MRSILILLLALWIIDLCEGASRYIIHRKSWKKTRRLNPDEIVSFSIALVQPDIVGLEQHVLRISDPSSDVYGQFYSDESIRKHIEPVDDVKAKLSEFLSNYNVSDQYSSSVHGDYVSLALSVMVIENMFQTQLHEYTHRHFNATIARPHGEIWIPEALDPHIDFIDGLQHFPTEMQMQFRHSREFTRLSEHRGSSNFPRITPNFIRDFYKVPKSIDASHPNNRIAFASFLKERYSEKDTESAYRYFGVPVEQLPVAESECKAQGNPGGEAALDTQVGIGVSWNKYSSVFCNMDHRDPDKPFADDNQEPFLRVLKSITALEDPPAVLSISYSDDECAVPQEYARRVNTEFLKAGAKGITVVVSGGDNGIQGSRLISFCNAAACSRAEAQFPSSSPWVTTVGGSELALRNVDSVSPCADEECKYAEVVGTSSSPHMGITGGGGFSRLFDRPSYQNAHVEEYLTTSPMGEFNQGGRAYPDVSALSKSYEVIIKGRIRHEDGTSASAPAVAGLFSLMNKIRLEAGQPRLGFVNPLLYQVQRHSPSSYRDIIEGDNSCGSASQECCDWGFYAIPGWDPASGLGAILFDTFVEASSKPQSIVADFAMKSSSAMYLFVAMLGLATSTVVMFQYTRKRNQNESLSEKLLKY